MNRTVSRTRRFGHLHEIREINVMPLVDLLLQLFIAVVIFFPVVEYGMNINLPRATTDTIKREQTRTLSIDRAGNIYLNDVRKTIAQLKADLAALARQKTPVVILVKADQADNYGKVMDALKQLHAAGITRIALMTQEENAPKPSR